MENIVLFPMVSKQVAVLPFYITGISLQYLEGGIVRKEGCENYQWTYCIQGKGKLVIEGNEYTIEEGDAFFFEKNIPHQYVSIEEPWIIKWVTFDGAGVKDLLVYLGIKNAAVVAINKQTEIEYMLQAIYYLLENIEDADTSILKASNMLYSLIIHMGEIIKDTKEGKKQMIYEKLRPILKWMNEKYSEPITLEEMAATLGISKYYFCKLFKEAYGVAPFHYLNQVRIQKAKEYMLHHKEMKIKEIGSKVGFQDTSYFCATFKKLEGTTPIEFKGKYSAN